MDDDEKLHHPHDKLFKLGFSDPATAAAFLREQIPTRVSEAVDWPSLKLLPGSFIDPRFQAHESDLLFSASLAGSEVRIYLLFEHQTREDKGIALRLLRYMVSIWEKRPTGETLPPILPVVLAQNDREWKLRPVFSDRFDLPANLANDLRPFLPDFAFRLIQLAQIPFSAIRGTPAGIVVLRTLKAERSGKLLDPAIWDEPLLAQLPRALFEAFVLYLSNADIDTEDLERNLQSIQAPELKNTAMTFAQKLRQEGHQEGLQEGLQKGQQKGRISALQENLIDTLELRFGKLPAGLAELVAEMSDEDKLRSLLHSAIRSASLGEFSEGL